MKSPGPNARRHPAGIGTPSLAFRSAGFDLAYSATAEAKGLRHCDRRRVAREDVGTDGVEGQISAAGGNRVACRFAHIASSAELGAEPIADRPQPGANPRNDDPPLIAVGPAFGGSPRSRPCRVPNHRCRLPDALDHLLARHWIMPAEEVLADVGGDELGRWCRIVFDYRPQQQAGRRRNQ